MLLQLLLSLSAFPAFCLTKLWSFLRSSPKLNSERSRMSESEFCRRLPKTELHAHITGSITPAVLQKVWRDQKEKDPTFDLGDPVEVLETARKEMTGPSFFSLFSKYLYRLSSSKAHIQTCTRAILADFHRNGVVYLELRSIPRPASDISKEGYVQAVLEVINSAKERPECVYLILSIDRKISDEEALDTVDLAIKYKDKGVVGVDLSGNATKYDATHFHAAYKKAHEHGLKVTLHFAEMEYSWREEEMKALLEYEPDRLGHVVNPPEWAKEEIRRRQIGIEICLTSNVVCDLIQGGYPNHQFPEWWKSGACPLAICTDDAGIFGTTTGREYDLLMENFQLSKRDVVALAKSSADCIFGKPEDKEMILQKLADFEKSVEL